MILLIIRSVTLLYLYDETIFIEMSRYFVIQLPKPFNKGSDGIS